MFSKREREKHLSLTWRLGRFSVNVKDLNVGDTYEQEVFNPDIGDIEIHTFKVVENKDDIVQSVLLS